MDALAKSLLAKKVYCPCSCAFILFSSRLAWYLK